MSIQTKLEKLNKRLEQEIEEHNEVMNQILKELKLLEEAEQDG